MEADLRRELADCDAIPTGLRWTLHPSATLNPGRIPFERATSADVDGRHSTRLRQIHHALEGRS